MKKVTFASNEMLSLLISTHSPPLLSPDMTIS